MFRCGWCDSVYATAEELVDGLFCPWCRRMERRRANAIELAWGAARNLVASPDLLVVEGTEPGTHEVYDDGGRLRRIYSYDGVTEYPADEWSAGVRWCGPLPAPAWVPASWLPQGDDDEPG